jgi:zinc transport system substrate-binding protein
MSDLSASRVWILSGTEFEKSLKPKISALYPSLLIVDGTAGVKFRSLEESLPEDGHDEASGRDPHTWLGREPVLILGRHIRDALTGIDPDHKTAYESNFLSMERQINDTFAGLRGKLRPLQGRSVLVFHPAFGYFLDEFGIRQSPVETGGKEPGPRALADLILQARREKVPVLFVQAQFSDRAARTVAGSVGAEVLPLDPLDPDWIGNIRRMGESLAKAVPVPP